MVDAVETMAWAGEVPWHGLGKRVLSDLTTEQMQTEAGLDWSVNKIPLYYNIPQWNADLNKFEDVSKQTDKFALVRDRDNRMLSVISQDWEPVQNTEAFEFFTDFIKAGDMEMHTAGSLCNGEIVWVLARVKEEFKVFGRDEVDSYLLFSNPHQYGKSIDIRFTPIRVVCWNTLSMALGRKTDLSVTLNHRKAFDPNMAKRALGIASQKMTQYKEMAEFLGSKRYTTDNVVKYFNEVFPTNSVDADGNPKSSRNSRKAVNYLETQPGAEFGAGTWWSAVNAVTFMTNHVIGHNNESRLESTWYGSNRKLALTAMEKAVEYAEAV